MKKNVLKFLRTHLGWFISGALIFLVVSVAYFLFGIKPSVISIGPINYNVPIQQTKPNTATDLNWDDSIEIESSFLMAPRPCQVRLTAVSTQDLNSRNILAHIIQQNGACDVVNNLGDESGASLPIPNVDAASSTTQGGLVMRWASSYTAGEAVYQTLNGFLVVSQGHSMPDNSPPNLIWIQVGNGYPWKR